MATVNGLRRTLDAALWELKMPSPVASAAATFIIGGEFHADYEPEAPAHIPELMITSASVHYFYDHEYDAWQQIVASGIAGTFGAGSCGTFHGSGPAGTATAGSTTTMTTTLTLTRRLDGFRVRITGGTGAGQSAVIKHNTLGANSVITFTTTLGTGLDATSTYLLMTGRFWFWNAGTASTFGLRYFDYATMTWSGALDENLAATATWGTDGKMVGTSSLVGGVFATGTATAGAASTLTDSGKAWGTNQWANAQIRITAGTGVGQVRTIASNTGTVLTTSAAWTTNPDATSVYAIEGNDDYLYLIGNNAVTLFRYSISGNAWTTLSPGVARGAAAGLAATLNWITGITDEVWTAESAYLNGRYLYSFRGAAGGVLDVYDIAANSWAALTYAPAPGETFTTGSCGAYDGAGTLYLMKEATGRVFAFDIVRNRLFPYSTMLLTQGAAIVGDRMWIDDYRDGATTIRWVYYLVNTGTALVRSLVI